MSRAISTSTNYRLPDRTSNGTENATNEQAWSCASPCCLSRHPLLADPVTWWSILGPANKLAHTRSPLYPISAARCQRVEPHSLGSCHLPSLSTASDGKSAPWTWKPSSQIRSPLSDCLLRVHRGQSAPGFEALLFFYPSKQCNDANMLAPLPNS